MDPIQCSNNCAFVRNYKYLLLDNMLNVDLVFPYAVLVYQNILLLGQSLKSTDVDAE